MVNIEGYEELANAIIIRAVEDYRRSLRTNNIGGIADCENFFNSSYFANITKVEGSYIIEKVRKEYEDGETKSRKRKTVKIR